MKSVSGRLRGDFGEGVGDLNEAHADASKQGGNELPDTEVSDLDLVQRAQTGDEAAFEALFLRYRGRAYAVVLGVLKHPQDAMDVVQQGFIKAHRNLGKFKGTSSFYTWFYRIIMNLAIDHIRRQRRKRSVNYEDHLAGAGGDDDINDSALAPTMADADPAGNVDREELRTKLQQALAELPEHHRAVILLREVEGMSYEEIAETLNVPKGTVMSRLFHARRKLQTVLGPYLEGEP